MTAPVNFYADLNGLAALKKDASTQDPKALREAARQFESLFTQMMLKSMRDAERAFRTDESFLDSDQSDFYREMFDKQLALQLSKGKGLGLAEMLVKQLTVTGATRESRVMTPDAGRDTANVSSSTLTRHASPVTRHDQDQTTLDFKSSTDFVRRLWPHAAAAGRELGVEPQVLIAQAALETGWGKFVPCHADGTCSFNLFGIKAGSRWRGATVGLNTLEFEDGVAVRRQERFRAYASPADCFRDYVALIKQSPRYAAALHVGGNSAAFAQALQQGGYATDPNYASKLTAIAQRVTEQLSGWLKSEAAPPLARSEGMNVESSRGPT